MDGEWRGHALLGREQAGHVGVDLADLVGAIDARGRDAVTTGLLDAGEVVSLVRGDGEQCVALVDAVRRKAAEESRERVVI